MAVAGFGDFAPLVLLAGGVFARNQPHKRHQAACRLEAQDIVQLRHQPHATDWHHRHRPNVANLRRRREGQPARVVALADRAMYRLNRRFNRMLERGKPRPKIAVAIARELAGFVWAALRPVGA